MLKKSYLLGLLSTVCFAQDQQDNAPLSSSTPGLANAPNLILEKIGSHLSNRQILATRLLGVPIEPSYSNRPVHILSHAGLIEINYRFKVDAHLHWEVTPEQQESLDLSKFKSITFYAISLSPQFIEAVKNNPNCKVTILTHGANVTKFMNGEFTGEQAHRNQPQPTHQARGLRRGQPDILLANAFHDDDDDTWLPLPGIQDQEDASDDETPEATSPTYQFPENLTVTDILNTLSDKSKQTVNKTWATIQKGFFTNQKIKNDTSRDGLICYILANTVGNELISNMNEWALYDLICAIYYLPPRDISQDNLRSIADFASYFSSRIPKDRSDQRYPDVFSTFLKNPNFMVQVAKTSLQLKQVITYIAPENLNPYIDIIINALRDNHAIDDVRDYFIATKPDESRTPVRFPKATYKWEDYLRFKELKQAGLIEILSTYQPALSEILNDSTLTVENLNKIKTNFPGITGWTINLINEALLNPEEVRKSISVLQQLGLADRFSRIYFGSTLLSLAKFDNNTITHLNRWQNIEHRFNLAVSTADAINSGSFV